MITEDYVIKIFKALEHGDGAGFFEHVDDKVDWIVEGTHPLAGHYKSKSDFLAGTFTKLGKVLPNGAQLIVEHLLVKDDQAVVELHSLATAKNGLRFDNRYCWVVHFDGGTIDRVRAYLDSAMVARLFEENPIQPSVVSPIMDPAQAPAAIEFGRFQVLPHRRELLAEGRPLELGGRAFDVLMALIEASGAVVSEGVLMERVWPNRIVEKNSVQAQISALRRAFGADRDLIRTIAGRGYQFTGEVRTVSARSDAQVSAGTPQPAATPSRPPTNLPEPVSELIGRDGELDAILDLSASHRLVTLTGAGANGKPRLAFPAARHLLPRFADGVWAIELAPLTDPELVPVAVATALGLELAPGTASPQSVASALRSKQLMLVLDNCEHVLDAAARLAEALLRANPAVRVIATSREPLRAEGEWVYPVPPLAVPAEDSLDNEDPLRYGAVRLFLERARAAAPHFSPDARVAAAIAGICRRLDGIPLAIELAAAPAAALGIESVSARLDDRFGLLAAGFC